MDNAEPIVVSRHIDPDTGVVTNEVHGWPRETSIDFFLLGQADAGHISVDNPVVILKFANGEARYRLMLSELDGKSTAIPAFLLSSRFSEPEHKEPRP